MYNICYTVKSIPNDFSEQIFDETSLKNALYSGACRATLRGKKVLIVGWDEKGFKIDNGEIIPYYHFIELQNIKKAAPLN